MKLSEFKFNETDVKRDVIYELKLREKLNLSFDFLSNHIPINKLTDDSFDFDKLEVYEGKNYNWFYLKSDDINLLVRQYGEHFTFFNKVDDGFRPEINIFTISNDSSKMDESTLDSHCGNNFYSLDPILPKLLKLIKTGKLHSIWNDITFPRPNYVDVKIGIISDYDIGSLDLVMFACDEIFSMYISTVAETDVVSMIGNFKIGDKFGSSYIITQVNDVPINDSEPNFHNLGLEFSNTNFPNSKPNWSDVYSLATYYSGELGI